MSNSLDVKVNIASILKYSFPSVILMVCVSSYTMIDGMFISRFIGSTALAATNIVWPFINMIFGFSVMFSIGGGALCAIKIGEGKAKEAKELFSYIALLSIVVILIYSALSLVFLDPILDFLGSNEHTDKYAYEYITICLVCAVITNCQVILQHFLLTSAKVRQSMVGSFIGGGVNIVLDYVLLGLFDCSIWGAAVATVSGALISSIYMLYHFKKSNNAILNFVKPKAKFKEIIHAIINGSSEFVTSSAQGVTIFLFNITLLAMIGEVGVSAITALLYAQFFFSAAFLGFSNAISPVIGFNYGADNRANLVKVIRNSQIIVLVSSLVIFIGSMLTNKAVASLFAGNNKELTYLIVSGGLIFNFQYLFCGFNIFTSSMFTAYSNGKISAVISFSRTFLFITICILALPQIIGITGIWLAVPVAETLSIVLSIYYVIKYRNRYHYWTKK